MNHKGFTIVELLIVIVVIAILAAISIVAFTGIQDRAQNTAKIQAAQQLAKAFDVAVLKHEVNLGTNAPYCLPIGLSDINGDGRPPCGYTGSDGAYFRAEKTPANTMLLNAGLTNLSFPDSEVAGNNGAKYRGIQVTYGSGVYGVDGVRQPYFLYFFLKGENQDCSSSYSIGQKVGNDNIANPLFTYTNAKHFASNNGMTTCAYTIRLPGSL
jgi:prepilin-type N-terminal cleavage/methylation domain-containing protein